VENELGAVLYYEQTRRFEKQNIGWGLDVDVLPILAGPWGMCSPMGRQASRSDSARNWKMISALPGSARACPGSAYFPPRERL